MIGWTTRLLLLGAAFAAQAQPVMVGAVVSQSGAQADLAAGYAKGIQLWQSQVNAGGGLLGRTVELKLLDDGSDAVRAGVLYRQLIGESRADVLIGPYGSAATRVAAAEADRERKVMVNGAGPARVVQEGPTRFVFPAVGAYATRGDGVLALARAASLKRLFIVSRQDFAAQEIAEAMRAAALKQGFVVSEVESYSPY